MKYTIRKSIKGNYGIFYWKIIQRKSFVRYPICTCPLCHIGRHPVNDSIDVMGWVAVYVATDTYQGFMDCCKVADAMNYTITTEVDAQS